MHKNDNSFSKSKALLFKLELLKLEVESLKNKVISNEKEDSLDNNAEVPYEVGKEIAQSTIYDNYLNYNGDESLDIEEKGKSR